MRRDYDDPIYAEWRKRVFSRDKHKCQMPKCGYKRALNAHHIVRWSDAAYLRFDINNGITLCWKCHKEIMIFWLTFLWNSMFSAILPVLRYLKDESVATSDFY